ncbi:LysR family transcriptional regulator [Blastococcus saxobsidens]|uniref:DNA-binding transcriptional LysR family regulator n=1 Tax=Blastococcus saxobsidens TaxID=138336 RepID=A0A4Q7Y895_9ACTN|nr:LysR family transcriptional regulator [Blastococcus saxobsidens]RZU32205.1 DNA-binding transcriptional LysR family regulator [Blastococcus saxobsidens]
MTVLDGYRLEWLGSFLAVVDHGGFAAAAENVYRSQPSISSHVAELESRLGALLFDRKERPVRLTEAGMAFLVHARAVQAELEAGEADVQAVLGLLRGRVRLGCYPSAGAAFVPGALREFAAQYPAVEVALLEGAPVDLGAALQNGDADLAIRPLLPIPRESSVAHEVLWVEPLVAVVAEDHPLAQFQTIDLARLRNARLITLGSGTQRETGTTEMDHALRDAGLENHVVLRTNEPQTLVALARTGHGIGLTNLLAAAVSDTSGTRVIPMHGTVHRREVGVFWDGARAMQPAVRAFLDLILQMPVPDAVQRYERRA